MNKKVVRGLEFYTMANGGFFGDPGDSPEAYSSDSFAGGTTNLVDTSRPSGPEAAAGGPDPFDRPSSSSRPSGGSGGDSGESSAPPATVVIDGVTYSTATTPGTGSDDEDEDQMVQQILATPEEDRNWVEKRIANLYEKDPSKLGEVFYDPDRADFTGYMSEAPFTGGLGGFLAALFGKPQGLVDGKRPKPMAYTGFGRQFIFDSDDDERASDSRPVAPPPIPAPTTSPELTPAEASYFARGVGTGTTFDLTNPEDIRRYLLSLYGSTPSPLGKETSAYGLDKKKKRMRGLDIFKPVSIL